MNETEIRDFVRHIVQDPDLGWPEVVERLSVRWIDDQVDVREEALRDGQWSCLDTH
jgi:hypothetical protein